eukprot:COSAG01_NODE_9916_length_2302_cov_2.195642_2_plen_84_part_00
MAAAAGISGARATQLATVAAAAERQLADAARAQPPPARAACGLLCARCAMRARARGGIGYRSQQQRRLPRIRKVSTGTTYYYR